MARARLILAVLIAVFASHAPAMAASLDELEKAWPPATFNYQLDSKRAVSAAVAAAKGGELTAKGKDGTIYRLVIPSSALLRDEKITMTPFASASGLPGQTAVHGVDLQPAGLELMDGATLSIALPAKDGGKLAAFHGAGESGAAAVRAALIQGSVTNLVLFHFSATGVAAGDDSTVATIAPAEPSLDAQVKAMDALAPPAPGSPNFLPDLQNYIEAQVGRLLQLEANGTYSHDRAWENIGEWQEIADELALLVGQQAAKTAEAGNVEDGPAIARATFDLLRQAQMDEKLGKAEAAETLRRQLADLLTAYAASFAAKCAGKKIDPFTILEMTRHLQLLSLDPSNELTSGLMRCLPAHRMVANFEAPGGSAYEFSHCGRDQKGDWHLNVSGTLTGDGEGAIGDDDTGTWTGKWSHADLSFRLAGRLEYVSGEKPQLHVITERGTATSQGHTIRMPRTDDTVWPVRLSDEACDQAGAGSKAR